MHIGFGIYGGVIFLSAIFTIERFYKKYYLLPMYFVGNVLV